MEVHLTDVSHEYSHAYHQKKSYLKSAILAYIDGMDQTGYEVSIADLVSVFVVDAGNVIPSAEMEDVLMTRARLDMLLVDLCLNNFVSYGWGIRVVLTGAFRRARERRDIRYPVDYVFIPVNFHAPSKVIWRSRTMGPWGNQGRVMRFVDL
jgi:hypothetical protein